MLAVVVVLLTVVALVLSNDRARHAAIRFVRIPKHPLSWGAVGFLIVGLIPPWVHVDPFSEDPAGLRQITPIGYAPIYAPPSVSGPLDVANHSVLHFVRIDFDRLFVQWAIVVAVTGAALMQVRRTADNQVMLGSHTSERKPTSA